MVIKFVLQNKSLLNSEFGSHWVIPPFGIAPHLRYTFRRPRHRVMVINPVLQNQLRINSEPCSHWVIHPFGLSPHLHYT